MEEFDYSLLLKGEEVYRCKREPDGTVVTRYRRDLGPDIMLLFTQTGINIQEGHFPFVPEGSIPKRLRCHTKKRLKKLLMGWGAPCKAADIVAGFAKVHRDVDVKLGRDVYAASYLQSIALSRFFSDMQAEIRDNRNLDEKGLKEGNT